MMLPGLNGDGKKLASAVSEVVGAAATTDAGREERVVRVNDGAIYVRLLWRKELRTLAVMRADRVPSYEEGLVAREAAGLAEDCAPVIRQDWVVSQNAGIRVPVRALLFRWQAADVLASAES